MAYVLTHSVDNRDWWSTSSLYLFTDVLVVLEALTFLYNLPEQCDVNKQLVKTSDDVVSICVDLPHTLHVKIVILNHTLCVVYIEMLRWKFDVGDKRISVSDRFTNLI